MGKQNEGRDNVGKDDGDRESIYVWGSGEERGTHKSLVLSLLQH